MDELCVKIHEDSVSFSISLDKESTGELKDAVLGMLSSAGHLTVLGPAGKKMKRNEAKVVL
jgi:hypothetical protein